MSNVSNAHDVIPFVANKTKPLTGQRLAKVGYKTTEKTPAKFPSVAVSVPPVSNDDIEANLSDLLPYFRTFVADVQDKVIRSLYEESNGKLSVVTNDDISVSACISFLESEEAGDRLKKDHIQGWFDRVASENVFTLIAEKLGYTNDPLTEEQVKTVEKNVKNYRDILSMLAGGKTILTPQQIKGCRIVIDLSEDDSGIGEKLTKRLDAMEKPKSQEIVLINLD